MGMRGKKELRVVGKPSAELNCELLDSRVKLEDDTLVRKPEDDNKKWE